MPPKRSQPEATRQSARKKTKSAKQKEADQTQEASSNEVRGNQVAIQVLNNEPQPSTSQEGTHVRESTLPDNNIPATASQSSANDDLSSSSAPSASSGVRDINHTGVSRDEFNQLKDSMSSIKQMFSNFMATFKPSDNSSSQNVQVSQSSLPFDPPVSVPINQPVTSQPSSQSSRDPNLPGPSTVNNSDQAANIIVNQAIQEHIRSVSGGKASGKSDTTRISYQLDRKIPQNIMQDIWDDKYVDLELLIDKKDNPDLPMVMKSTYSNELGQVLQFVKPKQPKGILDIAQWSRAFDVYISIYTKKYYNETSNLLTYSYKVKEVASKGGDFLRYDEEFRKARSRFGSPWEVPDLELLVDCNQAGLQNQILKVISTLQKGGEDPIPPTILPNILPFPSDPTSPPQLPRHPPGSCYTYHSKGRCGRINCRFSHKCYNPGCNETHSVFTCPLSPNSGTGPVGPTGTGPNPTPSTTPTSSSHSNSTR